MGCTEIIDLPKDRVVNHQPSRNDKIWRNEMYCIEKLKQINRDAERREMKEMNELIRKLKDKEMCEMEGELDARK